MDPSPDLAAGPALDAKIAEWMGWHKPAGGSWWLDAAGRMVELASSMECDDCGVEDMGWCPSSNEGCMGQVLDRLIEKGYEPALLYNKETGLSMLCLTYDELDAYRLYPGRIPETRWCGIAADEIRRGVKWSSTTDN
jgi:hypothetical protein